MGDGKASSGERLRSRSFGRPYSEARSTAGAGWSEWAMAGGPLVRVLESLCGKAKRLEQEIGALEVEHVGGDGFDDLVEGRIHGEHVFERRKLEVEALVTGAVLGYAHESGAMMKVIEAKISVGDGGGVADTAVVVDVGASSEFHDAPRKAFSYQPSVARKVA